MEEQLQTTLILNIEHVEVHQTSNNYSSLVSKGPLSVLYVVSFNCFLIQVGDFSYHLSKEIPVLGSPSKVENGYPSYVFPNMTGYFVIKIIKTKSLEIIGGFETVLSNHCNLAYEELAVQEELGNLAKVEPSKTPVKASSEKKTKTDIATGIIYKGGELARIGLVKSAGVISKGIVNAGDYVQKKYVKKEEGKDLNESTVTKVKILNTTTDAVYKFSQVQIQGIIMVGKEIGKEVARKAAKSETGQKFENYKHHDTVVKVGKSTINAAANIFVGMYEALTIIGRGIETTTTKLVSHKYGEKAGSATKAGFDAVGNIGKIAEIVSIEGSKAVQEGTTNKQKAQF